VTTTTTADINLPAWLNPDVITPEMWAARPQILADTLEVARIICDVRQRLDAIYDHFLAVERPDGLGDDAFEAVGGALGTNDLFGLLSYLPAALDVTDLGVMTEKGEREGEALLRRVLGEGEVEVP
jgi:hypothetical protein